MKENLYTLAAGLIVLLTILLFTALLRGLRRGLQNARSGRRTLQVTGILLLLWLSVISVGAQVGFFGRFDTTPPRIMLVIAVPMVAIIALLFSKKFYAILLRIPPAWLFYLQSFRILMELILWIGYKGGFVPIQMTFEWLNFDIIVGLTAPMAGFTFFGRRRFLRFEGVIWNIFGLALLLNIVTIALLSAPVLFRVFFNEPANTFVAAWPFIWIPGFIVPTALALHLFSLRQLLSRKLP